jgi:hypothetical protein
MGGTRWNWSRPSIAPRKRGNASACPWHANVGRIGRWGKDVAYFVHQLLTDEPFAGLVSLNVSRDAQEILQAGIQSLASGAEVGLPLKAYLEG